MQAIGGAFRLLGGVIQQTQRAARSLEQAVQEVVEVLQPGPLGGTAARWDAQRRADADRAVQQALDNWRHLQAEQQVVQQQQSLRHQEWQQPQQQQQQHVPGLSPELPDVQQQQQQQQQQRH